jgi:hypothetical protein
MGQREKAPPDVVASGEGLLLHLLLVLRGLQRFHHPEEGKIK